MPETELYGKSHNLCNVRLLKDENHVGRYHVYVDGQEIAGVNSVDVHYSPDAIPTTDITIYSVPKIDHDLFARMHFEPTDIRECIKFLVLQLQFDNDFREAWILSIKSALDEMDEDIDNYGQAKRILDRIMDDGVNGWERF